MWESLRIGLGTFHRPGSGLFSFGTGILLLGLSVGLIYKNWDFREPKKAHSYKVVLALVFLLVYCVVVEYIGFVVATFFLIGILFRLTQRRPWWALIGMSLVVTSLAYLVFGLLLHVNLPRGLLGI